MEAPPRVVELALAARDYVQRAVAMELDGSIESLAFLDHYVAQVGDVDDDVLHLLAAAVGAYFGELVVAHAGATWHAQSASPAEWIVTFDAVPLSFRPVAMAAEAIRKDNVDDVDGGMTTLPTLASRLEEALAAVGPVEADYYYSMTGRFETLQHAASVVAELQHQATETPTTKH